MKRTIGMTILLALVIGGCTLEDGNECQEGTPETYKNDSKDRCIKTSCIDGKLVDDTPYKHSCLKEDGEFTGYGMCLNGDTKPENPSPSDKNYVCADGDWKEVESVVECTGNAESYQNGANNRCIKTTCVDGREERDESCTNSCFRDEASNLFTGCGECLNNDEKCENDHQYKCEDGTWKESYECTYGCDSATNKCVTCFNDSFRCMNDKIETCINNSWTFTKECLLGCASTSACVECNDGEDRCENSELQTCIGGVWSKVKTCSNGCNSETNTCNTPKVPKAGDLCVPETFEEVCTNSIYYTCVANRVKENKCGKMQEKRCAETDHGQVCSLSEEYTAQCSAERTYIGTQDVCSLLGKQSVYLCDKDKDGNNIAVEKTGPSVCVTHPPFGAFLLSCDGNGNEVEKRCKSCEYDSSGNAVCITDDMTAEHHNGDSCSDPNARACDGDILIKCNGTKYVAVNTNEQGEIFECGQVNSSTYCDELRGISYAQCVQECKENDEVGAQYYSVSCKDNLIERSICQIGQSGKKGVFGGVFTPSICSATNVMKTCSTENNDTVDKPCPGGCTMVSKETGNEAVCALQP